MRRMVFSIIGIMVVLLLLARPSLAQERGIIRQDAIKSTWSSSAGRLALLIGNSAYTSGGNLRNPVNDVRDIKAALEELGFRVIKYENCTQRSMKEAIDDFGEELRGHEVGLFFYAGHGVQVGGENYLVPVDAKLQSEKVVEYDCVRADRVLAMMEGAGSKTNIVIIDACRDNPFERSWRRGGASRGLAFMNAPSGALIAYATAPGRTAGDGTGRNGVYTAALLDHVRTAGITIEQMFKRVRVTVEERTNKAQTPWESTSLRGEFYFLAGGTPVARVNTSGPTAILDPLADERARLEKEREELARLKMQEEKRKIEEERQRLEEERKKLEVERAKPQPAPGPAAGQEVGRDGVCIAYANGIVKDTKTGLEWVAGPDEDMTWNHARAWVESLNVGGGEWRMPKMKELEGLFEKGKGSRNMTSLLKTTGWWVWSGDRSAAYGSAFGFYSRSNRTDSLSNANRAFAVRSRGDVKTQEENRKIEEGRQRPQEETKKLEVERLEPGQTPAPAYGQEVGRDGVYIAYANGIVKDTKTGLEWVVGPDGSMTWDEAKAWVESLSVGGGGWRMPTVEELKGLYQYGKGSRNMTPMLKITGYCVWSGQSSGGGHMLFDFASGFATGATLIYRTTSRDDRAFAVRTRGDG
jgi:hypothetical protein